MADETVQAAQAVPAPPAAIASVQINTPSVDEQIAALTPPAPSIPLVGFAPSFSLLNPTDAAPGEATTPMWIPRTVQVTTAPGKRVLFKPGAQEVPVSLSTHPYLLLNGAKPLQDAKDAGFPPTAKEVADSSTARAAEAASAAEETAELKREAEAKDAAERLATAQAAAQEKEAERAELLANATKKNAEATAARLAAKKSRR